MTVSSESVSYVNPELTEIENAKPGRHVNLPFGYGPIPENLANKKIFFFDIDNCLYPPSMKINDMMQVKIHDYFKQNLQLNDEEAHNLHMNYYKTYGLAIEGLVRNHQVDALDYNSKVDDALDLHAVLRYDKSLRDILITIKESHKFDLFWLITNAYKNHALRVVSFLGIGDLFDGLTFCDYSKYPIVCKPMKEYFYNCFNLTRIDYHDENVMKNQYFIDDSELNVKAVHNLGMGHVYQYVESSKDVEKLKLKPDFKEYYNIPDGEHDSSKITIVTKFSDLPKILGCS